MSSDQPGKPPSQAGRFKPRKPAVKKPTSSIRASSATSSSSSAGRTGRGDSSGRSGRGRGRGRDDGRGRGRGRGRFAVPKGQVFFTGSAAAAGAANISAGNKKGVSNDSEAQLPIKEEVIHMPGMGSSNSYRGAKGSSQVGKTAQERLVQSAMARSGEGEEVIVAEMEEGSGIGDGKTKTSVLNSAPKDFHGPSMFDNEGEDDRVELSVGEYTYDSDSSTDGDAKRAGYLTQKRRKDGRSNTSLQPQRLPFPPPRKPGTDDAEVLYKSQELKTDENEEKNADIMTDPPLRLPFLNLREATSEQKREEQFSWMVFKLPTRLPRLAPHCTLSGRAMKSESAMEIDPSDLALSGVEPSDAPIPDVVASSTAPFSNAPENSAAIGYDDTLKDAAAGRYGKIVLHKSGKAYLVVGGTDSKTPQVKMLLSEGLSCGFLQQAVAIDPSQATYVPLGEVKKSLVVTPDVESAFELH